MATKEKWVNLFEQVTGRKPSPEEFMKGKESDFDLKKIREISGMDNQEERVVPFQTNQVSPPMVETESTETNTGEPVHSPKEPMSKESKRKLVAVIGVLATIAALVAGFIYLRSTTGTQVAADEFISAVQSNDYGQVAKLLSTEDEKWSKGEAKDFLTYLSEKDIDVVTEVQKVAASEGKVVFNDGAGNKLLGMREINKVLGIFPEYQVTSYPLEVLVETDIDNLEVAGIKLAKAKETSLGHYKFLNQTFKAQGKTSLGELETKISPSLDKAENNRVKISLSSSQRTIKALLPEEVSDVTDLKLYINGKESGNKLSKTVEAIDNQELEVHASFTYDGTAYTTNKSKVVIQADKVDISVPLSLASDASKKLKEEKDSKEKITEFLKSYRDAVFESIDNKENGFSDYYDTSSTSYQEMVNFVENQVEKSEITHYIQGTFELKSVTKEGDSYIVKTYEEFTSVYESDPNKVFKKDKTYYLRASGDSFLIYDLEEIVLD